MPQLSNTAAISFASRGKPGRSPAAGNRSDNPMPRRSNNTTREHAARRVSKCSSAGSSQTTSRWLVSGETSTSWNATVAPSKRATSFSHAAMMAAMYSSLTPPRRS